MNGVIARITIGGQGFQVGQGVQCEMGQATVTDESWVDVYVYGLWKWRTSTLFYMQIINLDVGSYLRHTSEKDQVTAQKEKMEKYLQICLERKRSFTAMV